MKIIVNGRDHEWTNPRRRIGYEFLVLIAGHYPEHRPTVTYQQPNEQGDILLPGKFAPIEDGTRFFVAHTGAA